MLHTVRFTAYFTDCFSRAKLLTLMALIGLLVSSCSTFGNAVADKVAPRVNVNSVTISSVTSTGVDILVGMNIFNPNSVSVPLRSLDYQFAVNGQQIAQGQQNQSLSIPANSGRDISLPIHLNLLQAAAVLPQVMSSRGLEYELTGNLGFPFIRLPFSRQGGLSY